MDEDFETEDEIYASITPRKFDRHTAMALWFQYRANKKLVRGDFYISIAQSLLLHREYNVKKIEFQEQAGREIEALVSSLKEEE